jgi:hypothetical protein
MVEVMMVGRKVYEFQVDSDCTKEVTVPQATGRDLDVKVRYLADGVINEFRAPIRNAIDLQVRRDEFGLVVDWKQPFIVGWDWLTYSRRRRF